MDAKKIEDIFTLAPAQQGMLFQILAEPDSPIYFEQMLAGITGTLDVAAFEHAWQRIVDRHPSFRTAFFWHKLKHPVQVAMRRARIELTVADCRRLSPAEQQARLEAFLAADRSRGFDLARPPLTRLHLMRLSDRRHRLVWSTSHLVIDAWCVAIVLREVLVVYHATLAGRQITLSPAAPYRDYVAWLKEQDFAGAERYWRRRLAGFLEPTPIGGEGGPGVAGEDHRRTERALSVDASAALHRLVRAERLTLHSLALGAWGLLLGHRSGRDEVLFGAVFSGRPPSLAGVETMVGLFINTLPVRLRLPRQQPFVEWLGEVLRQQLEVHEHEACPLARVLEWSELPRDRNLFESILVFFNVVDTSLLTAGELEIDQVGDLARSNFPLVVRVTPAEPIGLQLIYDPRRFDDAAAGDLLASLAELLEAVAASPGATLADLREALGRAARERRQKVHSRRRERAAGRLRALRTAAGSRRSGEEG